MVAIGGAWRQSAAVGGRTPPSREPSGIFERHPPVYAVGLLQRDRGAWRGGCTPGQKSGKLHSGRIPQAGTTEPAHRRAMEFSEALKSPPGGARVAATASRIPRAHPKKGNLLEMKSGQPVPCVGVAARLVALWMAWRLWILPPIREREAVSVDRWVKFLFTLQARAGVFWKAHRLLCFPVQPRCFFTWAMVGYESIFLERARSNLLRALFVF